MKIKSVCFLIVALLLLCACAETPPTIKLVPSAEAQTAAPTSEAQTEETVATEIVTEPPTETPQLRLKPQYKLSGEPSRMVLLDDKQFEALKAQEKLQMLSDYPIFDEEYYYTPFELFVEVTPELTAEQIAYGQAFLEILYGTDGETFSFDHYSDAAEHVVWFENEEVSMAVNPWQIRINQKAASEERFTPQGLMQNEIVKAAIKYQKIRYPEMQQPVNVTYKGEVTSDTVIYAEHSDDPVEALLNREFHSVSVEKNEEDGSIAVTIRLAYNTELEERVPSATEEQLKAFLAEVFPNDPPEVFAAEAYYSGKLEFGKEIPCYLIYILEPELAPIDGKSVYSIIQATTAEFAVSSDESTGIAVFQNPTIIQPIGDEELEATENAD